VFGYVVAGILGLVLAWIGIGIVTEHGVKEPAFVIERSADGYEVRRYDPYLVAETQIPPGTEDPLGTGFRMLFKYIGGANQISRKIEMTAPVLKDAEKIPMTKPVLRRQEQGMTRVAFVLPPGYTMETAPQPNDSRIRIREIPARRLAVLRFSGYATDSVVEEKRARLVYLLSRDGLRPAGGFVEAYYNPPWTPPFMRRNEVMIDIE